MVQICYLRLSLAIETVSYHLLPPTVRVSGHGGLKLNLKRGRLCPLPVLYPMGRGFLQYGMAFSIHEVVRVVCQSRSRFVYAPL